MYHDFPFQPKGLFYISISNYNPESVNLKILGNANHLYPTLGEKSQFSCSACCIRSVLVGIAPVHMVFITAEKLNPRCLYHAK